MLTTEGEKIRRTTQTKTAGEYTGKAQGQCQWGGCSSKRIKQCNFLRLRKLVKTGGEADENREDKPKRMEELLMGFCRTMVGIVKDLQDD